MHSVAQPGAPAYSTRPPLVSPPSSTDPSQGRAPTSTAAYTAQSALSSSASARQLPPGAAYASDHAQQHRVTSSFALPSSAPQPAGFPSSTSTAPRDPRQDWARHDGDSVMPQQQIGPVYGMSGDSGVVLPSDSVGRGADSLPSGVPDFRAGRPRPTTEATDASASGEPAAPNWSISLQEPTPPPSQHFAASSIDARQASPRSPSSIARPTDFNSSRPQPVALAQSSANEEASSSGATVPGGPAAQRPRMVDRHSFEGIPGGRLPSSPSTRAAVDATEAQSRIPSFSPAAAFSPQDRGPYPPHAVSPTRVRQDTVVKDEVLADRAQAYSPVMSGAPELPPTDLGRPGSLAFDTSAFPSDLAGIGRNSVIRAAASPPLFTATSSPVELGGPSTSNPASAARSPQLVNPSPQALAAAQQAAQTSPAAAAAYTFPNPNQNVNASFSLPTPPPHLVPQPEICVECMMRDRDMADVDVTTPGVWDRASDADFEEQMRWEAETTPDPVASNGGSGTPAASSSWSGEHTGSLESAAGPSKRRESSAAYSRESLGGRSSLAHGVGGNSSYKGRKRLGRGQILTSGNLKVWTTMNPPAAAHRWRTLQTYLATQAHYLELDRQSRDAEASQSQSQSLPVRLSQHTARTSQGSRSRSSSMLSPAALAAEKAAMEQEERSRRAKGKGRNPSRGTLADETNRLSSASLLPPPIGMAPMMPAPPRRPNAMASSGASMRSYSSGDQPWLGNQLRRISTAGRDLPPANASFDSSRSHRFTFSPFSRSAVDLRGVPSPRSVSPARTNDDRRTSMWSRFRRSGSPSVFSYAPSGSMLDMHLGLSQDKHMPYANYPAYETYPSRSDPAVARHAETARREEALAASQATGVSGEISGGKKKRKGIKGFFNKLVGGGGGTKKPTQTSVSAPPTPGAEAAYEESYDDSELAPPPPLSALVNEPRYHQRSASNSSVDSFGPATPPVPGGLSFRSNGPMGYESGSLRTPADRQSVLTMGSLNSTRSRPIAANGHDSLRNGTSWPSPDSLRDPAGLDTGGEHEVLAGDEDSAGEYGSPKPQPQKSLPPLPSENAYAYRPPMDTHSDPNMPLAPPNAPYAHYTASRSAYSLDPASSQSNFIEEFGYDGRPGSGGGGGARDRSATVTLDGQTIRKARSRSKIFSMSFGKKSKQENIPPPLPHPNMRAHSLDSGVALGQGAGSPYREGVASAGYV